MSRKVTLAGRFRKRLSPLFLSVMFNGNILHPFIQWVIFAYSHAPPKNVIASPAPFLSSLRGAERRSNPLTPCLSVDSVFSVPPPWIAASCLTTLLAMTNQGRGQTDCRVVSDDTPRNDEKNLKQIFI